MSSQSLHLKGVLTNPTAQPIPIIVFPVGGHLPFAIDFKPNQGVTRITPSGGLLPPSVPSPPMEITIPAQSQILFDAGLNLFEYQYSGSPKVELAWTFYYWNEPQPTGTVAVQLPVR